MNSKKRLIILWVTFLLFFIQSIAFSQDANLKYLSNTFSISVPPIKPKQNPKAFYTYFLETGNGNFYRGSIADGLTIAPVNIPYAYSITPNSKAVLTLSAYYDTTRRPPRDIAIPISNNITTIAPNQAHLTAGVNILIDPCVPSIVPGDTMALAITYKPLVYPSASHKHIVAFFYNKQPLSAGNIFSIITESTPSYNFKGTPVNPIRTHHNEPFSSTIPDTIPDAVKQSLREADDGYTNALYFLVPSGTNERNIFISLAPDKDPSHYNSDHLKTGFGATIIQYDAVSVTAKQSINPTYDVFLLARDPNGITTSPHCLDSFPSPNNKPIAYKVDFQNDGGGTAKHVIVTVSVPKGIIVPSGFLLVSSIIKGEIIDFTKWSINQPEVLNTYELKVNEQKIVFRMNNINLPGPSLQQPDDILKRHGSISFILKTNPDRNLIKQCMYSDVSIVFTSITRGGEIKNPAITKSDLIRKICTHLSDNTVCPRNPTAAKKPDTP